MRIQELTLFTNKLQAQKQFHKSVFGVDFIEENDACFSFQIGWTKLTFKQSKEPHIYHYCYLIPSNKLEKAIDWLQSKVDLIETDGSVIHDHDHWNAKAIYFYDGVGNIGEFIVRYDLDNGTDGEFTYHDILCINEMGAPSKDAKKLNSILEAQVGTTIWKGDHERFAANGNQEGMFLVLNNTLKDKWYPTDIFPESVPFDAKIISDGKLYSICYDRENIKIRNLER